MKILKQIIYILLIIIIICSCKSKSDNKDKTGVEWSTEDINAFLEGCIASEPIKGLTPEETEEYCRCVLEKTIIEYPNNDYKGDYLPNEFVMKAGTDCLEEIKNNKDEN